MRAFRRPLWSDDEFESVEDYAIFGCVVIGSDSMYHVLVYDKNEQNVAKVRITAEFEYKLSGLFLRIEDLSSQTQWSILFDTFSELNQFVRCIVATMVHVGWSLWDGDDSSSPALLRRNMPRLLADDEEENDDNMDIDGPNDDELLRYLMQLVPCTSEMLHPGMFTIHGHA